MTDKDKIKQMEDANWKPSNQHWKDKAEKLQEDLDILSLPDPNILILSEKVDQLQEDLTNTALYYLAAEGQAQENLERALDAEEKLNEAMTALQKVQAFVKEIEPYADQGHTLVPSLLYACDVYNKLKGDT